LQYMSGKYEQNGIITRDKYGDWCVPPESPELIHSKDPLRNTDGQLIATAYYFHLLKLMSRFAGLLHRPADAAAFAVSASALWVVSALTVLGSVSVLTVAGLFCAVAATLSRILVKKEIQSKMRVITASYGLIINYNRIDGMHGGDDGIYIKIGTKTTSGGNKMLLPCIPDL